MKGMRYLRSFLNLILDSCLAWFTPGWRRRGRDTASALSRYLHHFRPRIQPERLAELTGWQKELREALFCWNRAETERLTLTITTSCESLPGFTRPWFVEMAESFFVIMVVFLGIRTYYAQPFRIPTGSMQPSLNGIIVHPVEEIPSAPKRWWDALTLGSSYVEEVASYPKSIVGIQQRQKWLLFTETVLTFDDHSTISIPSAQGAVLQYLREQGKLVNGLSGAHFVPYRAGETIIRARVDAGDMVIVNRMAYHFRRPQRGETFVFDTRGLRTGGSAASHRMQDQDGGTHYIKRLCGLPGDRLRIQDPVLMVNVRPATESTIARVAAGEPPFNREGYQALSALTHPGAFLTDGREVSLRRDTRQVNLNEYVALGDNTTNSLDSRYWGPVHQFNIIGPAAFSLWPFTPPWGLID